MLIRTNYCTLDRSECSDLFCETPSLTEQSFKDSMDINNILARCVSGDFSGLCARPAQYLDTTQLNDFQENMNRLSNVRNYFDALPSELRAKFNNDLRTFTEFCSNPSNVDIMREMGLLPPAEPVKPSVPAEPVIPAPKEPAVVPAPKEPAVA